MSEETPVDFPRLSTPEDAGFDSARRAFNRRLERRPAAIAYCADAREVLCALDWARQRTLPVGVRSHGNDYEARGIVENGLVVDVSSMTHIEIDAENRLVCIGPGVQIGALNEALAAQDLIWGTGTEPHRSVAGFVLGGGHGLLARRWGMGCDQLLAVEVVTAKGEIVAASETRNPELLWACRGGGGVGVVTQLTLRVQRHETVTAYRLEWPRERAVDIAKAWQGWAPEAVDQLGSSLSLSPETSAGTAISGIYLGPEYETLQVLQGLRRMDSAANREVEELTLAEALHRFAGLAPAHRSWQLGLRDAPCRLKGSSDYAIWPLSDEAMTLVSGIIARAPSLRCSLRFESYGGAVSRLPGDATAFPHRLGTLYHLHLLAAWQEKAADEAHLRWMNEIRATLSTYSGGTACRNFPDVNITAWHRACLGDNLPRLQKIWKHHDPEGIFQRDLE